MSDKPDVREFQAETRKLLDLMIHSVYSNKDTFLRELISNSSDALDKLRMETYRDKDLDADVTDLHIRLEPDATARTLRISDNGIGMSRDEVVDLIGTVAKSGTGALRSALQEAANAGEGTAGTDLIGQFGIGFYSTFMVADEVRLVTRKAGEDIGTAWSSRGDGTYSIADAPDAPQGTTVTLHLTDADPENHHQDYADEHVLRSLVRRYSDFIAWPIRMDVEREVPAEAGDGAEDGDDAADAAETRTEIETLTLNSMKALWTRPKEDVESDEYTEFYRHVAHAWDDPLETIRLSAEGTFEYQALLFIPTRAPFDLFSTEYRQGVQLYVKRVFIMDDCADLLPPYLRFVKGVVDAQDLSLNVSRELLQQDRQIRMIRRRLVKKVLSTLADLRRDRPADFATFWAEFGAVLKEGLLSDPDNRTAILELCRFVSTRADEAAAGEAATDETGEDGQDGTVAGGADAGASADSGADSGAADEAAGEAAGEVAANPLAGSTDLRGYVERMRTGQEDVFYLTGPDRRVLERSPHVEAFAAKGVEVLLLTDPVDEVWVDAVGEFDGRRLRSVAKGTVDLSAIESGDEAGTEDESQAEEGFADFLTALGGALDESVKQVRLTNRLTSSPSCVVGDEYDMTPTLERLYRASGQPVPRTRRILELNPRHPLVASLAEKYREGDEAARDAAVRDAAVLYGLAVLAEGGQVDDPAAFAQELARRLSPGS